MTRSEGGRLVTTRQPQRNAPPRSGLVQPPMAIAGAAETVISGYSSFSCPSGLRSMALLAVTPRPAS
jgi:hypothetical protein